LLTRKTWVSTATAASPKTKRSMMSALFRPTPGRRISSSRLDGTTPACPARSASHMRLMLRAFIR
jgi:hypothetical protein